MAANDETKHPLGRVLVIGGNGFLGSHIIRQLLKSWDTTLIASVDLRCTNNCYPGVEYREVDITDPDAIRSTFEHFQPDLVVHTASPTAIGSDTQAQWMRNMFYRVNVLGTKYVIEACQATGVKALVFTSSASIMSNNVTPVINADETLSVKRGKQQSEYYSETKAAAEELVLKANRQEPHNLLTASIRPSGLFGENDRQTLLGAINNFRAGQSTVQLGEGHNIFDFTYVGNAAHAHLLAGRLLLATHASGTLPPTHERIDGEAFIITNDEPVYFWDFVRAVWRCAGSDKGPKDVWVLPKSFGYTIGLVAEVYTYFSGAKLGLTRNRIQYSTVSRYYNISKAKRVLGYKPMVSLQEGIEVGVSWFRENMPTVL